jgi:hypothetical protein
MDTETVPPCCWICGRQVELKTCTTDEDGSPVHEACHLALITDKQQSLSPIARGRLLTRSDLSRVGKRLDKPN